MHMYGDNFLIYQCFISAFTLHICVEHQAHIYNAGTLILIVEISNSGVKFIQSCTYMHYSRDL